ncbi:hypothetical protein HPB51_009304 [Rhipicephalus microplus]|uniref:HTH CENPB-type domain-containing protein n=1 Tax=Rhipicephalus microplus TaxID=6941 RepID=A0A9J6F1P5_RHIMP|nr:hypothetical protein HPB51_009304 [Rhipicephalus microplus]
MAPRAGTARGTCGWRELSSVVGAGPKTGKFLDVEKAVLKYVMDMRKDCCTVSLYMIRTQAPTVFWRLRIATKDFHASSGWTTRFMPQTSCQRLSSAYEDKLLVFCGGVRSRWQTVARSKKRWTLLPREPSQGVKNSKLVKKHGVSKSTRSTFLNNKKKITSTDNMTERKRLRRATNADMEDALLKWFVDVQARNIPISGPKMLAKAKDFAFLLDFPDFCPGNDWLHHFKVRHGIVFKSIVGEAASASDQEVLRLEANLDTISSYAE